MPRAPYYPSDSTSAPNVACVTVFGIAAGMRGPTLHAGRFDRSIGLGRASPARSRRTWPSLTSGRRRRPKAPVTPPRAATKRSPGLGDPPTTSMAGLRLVEAPGGAVMLAQTMLSMLPLGPNGAVTAALTVNWLGTS